MYDGRKLLSLQVPILASAWRLLRREAQPYRDPSVVLRESRREPANAQAGPERRRTVGATVAAYVDWRSACTDVESASHSWAAAPEARAEPAYNVYAAALDREQAAAQVYAELTRTVGRHARRREALDAAFDAYLDWRDQCDAVHGAYAQWKRSRDTDQAQAFSAYERALDREEFAAEIYAETMTRTQRQMSARPAHVSLGTGSW
jgi:hypothetical protein